MSFCSKDVNNCINKMSDGRHFTDYRPRCIINTSIIEEVVNNTNINSSYDSRMYLQQNANKIMDRNKKNSSLNVKSSCTPANGISTVLPERYTIRCDSTSCTRVETNVNGLGDGRSY